jgi:hypothetical protein
LLRQLIGCGGEPVQLLRVSFGGKQLVESVEQHAHTREARG